MIDEVKTASDKKKDKGNSSKNTKKIQKYEKIGKNISS